MDILRNLLVQVFSLPVVGIRFFVSFITKSRVLLEDVHIMIQ